MPDELIEEGQIPEQQQEVNPDKARTDYKLSDIKPEKDNDIHDSHLDLDDGEKADIVTKLSELITQAENDDAEKQKQFNTADKDYKGKIPLRSFPFTGASSIGIPVVKTKIRKLVHELKGALLRNRPIFPFEPQEESDIERVEKIENFIEAEAKKEMKIEVLAEFLLKDCGKYGTAICKVPFVVEKEKVTEHEEYDGANPDDVLKFDELYPDAIITNPDKYIPLHNGQKIKFNSSYEKEKYRGPKPIRVSRKNFVFPSGYIDIAEMPFVFEKIEKSYNWLKKEEEAGRFDKGCLDKLVSNYSKKRDPQEYLKKKHVVYDGFWEYEYKGVTQKCIFSLIPEEKIYLRGIKYPYEHRKPYFIPFYIIRDADSFDGEAIAHDLSDPQKLQNMIYNNAIDSDISNYPQYKALNTSKRNFDLETIYPNKVWWVDDMNEFDQMNTGVRSANSMMLMDKVVRLCDDVSNVSELQSGRESSGDPNAPASKSAMLLEQSQKGMSEYLKTFLISWNELAYQIVELYDQYGTEGKEYRVLNEQGKPALEPAPGDLKVRPDMEAHGGEPIFSKEGLKTSLLELMNSIKQDPIIMQYLQQYPQSWIKLWEKVVQNWGAGLSKSVHQIIPSQQFIEEEQIRIQMEAQKRLAIEDKYRRQRMEEDGAPPEQVEAEIGQAQQNIEQQTVGEVK